MRAGVVSLRRLHPGRDGPAGDSTGDALHDQPRGAGVATHQPRRPERGRRQGRGGRDQPGQLVGIPHVERDTFRRSTAVPQAGADGDARDLLLQAHRHAPQHGRAQRADVVGGPDDRDRGPFQQAVHEDARGGDRTVLAMREPDEDVLGFVEQQHRFAGRRHALSQTQAGQALLAVRLAARAVLLHDGPQPGADASGECCGEGGLAGAGGAIQQDVDAGLPACHGGGQEIGRHARMLAQMGEGIPWECRQGDRAEELPERVRLGWDPGADLGHEPVDGLEHAVAADAQQAAAHEPALGLQRVLHDAGLGPGEENEQRDVHPQHPPSATYLADPVHQVLHPLVQLVEEGELEDAALGRVEPEALGEQGEPALERRDGLGRLRPCAAGDRGPQASPGRGRQRRP